MSGAGRYSFRREAALGLGTYAVYLLVRKRVWTDEGRRLARANAELVVELERRLGLSLEPRVQRAFLRRPRLVHGLNAGYAMFNIGLTLGVLRHLFRRRDPSYHSLRTSVLAAYLGALPVFLLFPTAPPRVLDDFVDTVAEVSGVDIEHPLLVRFYNPIAAMPSLHVALAVLTGGALAARSRWLAGRAAAHAYAPVVSVVVVATGNHYLLDVAAGGVLGTLAAGIGRR